MKTADQQTKAPVINLVQKRDLLSRSLWGVFLCDTLGASATGLFIFVYPLFITQLGGTGIQVGIIFSVSLIVAAVSYLPGAILVHRVDRKVVMILSMVTVPVSMLVLWQATSWIHVLIAEALWFSGNFGAPAFITYITEASPKEKVMHSFGIVYAGPALAYVVAPIAGAGLLFMGDSIRPLFLVACVLRIAAPLALLMIDSQMPKESIRRAMTSLKEIFRIEPHELERILFLVSIVAVLSIGTPYLPLYLSEILGHSNMIVLLFGSIGYMGAALLSIGLAEMGDRKGGTIAVLALLPVFIAGCGILIGLDAFAATVVAVFLLGVMTAAVTIMDSIIGINTSEERRGGHLSLYLIAESLVMAPMPFIGGLLYDRVSPESPFILGAVLALALAFVTVWRRDLTDTSTASTY